MTIWRMRIACRITKATNTHTQVAQYLMFFPPQQWVNEIALLSRYTYIAWLVTSEIVQTQPPLSLIKCAW